MVGKGYGGVSEKNMMKEIMRNGAVAGEIAGGWHAYNGGILT